MAQAIGWDDEIDVSKVNEGHENNREDFVTLPAGEYPFKVVKFERGSYAGSEKIPACNKVTIGVVLDGGDKGNGYASTNFFMVDNQLWKIFRFLESVGLRQEGTVSIPWSKVEQGVGELEGRCKTENRDYNGKTYTDVKTWIKAKAPAVADDMPEF
jgi:hypothetical protein